MVIFAIELWFDWTISLRLCGVANTILHPSCGGLLAERTMALFRLHTENEGDVIIVATINSISSCNYPELSEVSSEFSELERTVIFRLLVKSDGEAEKAVDAENVIGAFAIGNAHFQKLLRFGVDDGTAVSK